jgi:hypothetical protein
MSLRSKSAAENSRSSPFSTDMPQLWLALRKLSAVLTAKISSEAEAGVRSAARRITDSDTTNNLFMEEPLRIPFCHYI